MTDPEKTRWVRYAADCAERVLGMTDQYRPQAEAAIRAARKWVDDPTSEQARACQQAVIALDHVTDPASVSAATMAAVSAAFAAEAAYSQYSVALVGYVEHMAARASWDPSERAWQSERRRFYGLEAKP